MSHYLTKYALICIHLYIIFLTQDLKVFTEGSNFCHNSENHNYNFMYFFFLGGGGVKYCIIKQIIHDTCIPR